jgi:hypothetical protein
MATLTEKQAGTLLEEHTGRTILHCPHANWNRGLGLELEDRVALMVCPRCTTLIEGVVLRDIVSKVAAKELAKSLTRELRGLK